MRRLRLRLSCCVFPGVLRFLVDVLYLPHGPCLCVLLVLPEKYEKLNSSRPERRNSSSMHPGRCSPSPLGIRQTIQVSTLSKTSCRTLGCAFKSPGGRETLENLGRSFSAEKHLLIVLAMEVAVSGPSLTGAHRCLSPCVVLAQWHAMSNVSLSPVAL